MKNLSFLFIVLGALILSSCNEIQELKIGNVESYKFKGFKENSLNFELTIPIENPNNMNIVISEINLNAFYKNKALGHVETMEKIVLKKNESLIYTIPVKIKITNLMAGISMLANSKDMIKDIYFEGYMKARKGILFTKIEIDKSVSSSYIRF